MIPGKWCVSMGRDDRKAHWFKERKDQAPAMVITSSCGLVLRDRTTSPLGSPLANDYPKCDRCILAENKGL